MKNLRLRKLMTRHPWYAAGGVIVIFVIASVFVIYHYEGQVNHDLSFFDAFRMVLVFFLGEYGDTPHTLMGRVISVLLFILGIGIVGTFIGKLSSVFVSMEMEAKMPRGLEDHIVICNWNEYGDRIVKELHSPLAVPDKEIVIITDSEINDRELTVNPEYEKVFFCKNDPTSHAVLKKANAQHAISVILLADQDCQEPDARNALIALAITKLEQNVQRNPHIVAEVVDHNKQQHLIDAGVDEWVCASQYGLGILAQCAIYGKLSDVYQQLLTYSEETNEIYLVDSSKYPGAWVGKSFPEIAELMSRHRKSDNPAILIGVKRDEEVILNPRQAEFDKLKQNDLLILIAFDPPNLNELGVSG